MKKIFLFLLLSFITLSLFSQSNNATVDETVEWIRTKITGSYLLESRTDSVKINHTKDTLKIYRTQDSLFKGDVMLWSIDIIPLKTLNPDKVTYYAIGNTCYIQLYTTMDKNVIKDVIFNPVKETGYSLLRNNVIINVPTSIVTSNENIGERLKTAFEHLIKICGGKPEKF